MLEIQRLQQQQQQDYYVLQQRQQQEQRRLLIQQEQIRQQLRLQEQQQRFIRQQQQEEEQRQFQTRQQQANLANRFRPSFTFQQSATNFQTPQGFQQLPSREAVDFLQNIRGQSNLPLQQNHIPSNFNRALPPLQQINQQQQEIQQQINQQQQSLQQIKKQQLQQLKQQQQPAQGFQTQQSSLQPSIQVQLPSQSASTLLSSQSPNTLLQQVDTRENTIDQGRNRIFRRGEDSQVGNFGVNPNFKQSYQPNYAADQSIRGLLYQQGIGQESFSNQENLNIVSKILSLNHVGGNFNGFLRRNDNF